MRIITTLLLVLAGLLLVALTLPLVAQVQVPRGGLPADPCTDNVDASIMVNQTAGTQLITGSTDARIFLCQVTLVSATAQNIALVYGTGTVCATGTGGLMGGPTAATGFNLAANDRVTIGTGIAAVAWTTAAAQNVCLLQSGSGQISGRLGVQVR